MTFHAFILWSLMTGFLVYQSFTTYRNILGYALKVDLVVSTCFAIFAALVVWWLP